MAIDLDLDRLLAPIATDAPSGRDLRYEPAFEALREAAEEFGQDKLRAALKALYPEPGGAPSGGETG